MGMLIIAMRLGHLLALKQRREIGLSTTIKIAVSADLTCGVRGP